MQRIPVSRSENPFPKVWFHMIQGLEKTSRNWSSLCHPYQPLAIFGEGTMAIWCQAKPLILISDLPLYSDRFSYAWCKYRADLMCWWAVGNSCRPCKSLGGALVSGPRENRNVLSGTNLCQLSFKNLHKISCRLHPDQTFWKVELINQVQAQYPN